MLAVYNAVKEAVDRAREGEGPSFVEARTYRLCGHHMGDIGFGRGYRTKKELDERWEQEPVGAIPPLALGRRSMHGGSPGGH